MSEEAVWEDVVRLDRFVQTKDGGKANKYLRVVKRIQGGSVDSVFIAMGVGREQTMIKLTAGEALLLAKVLEKCVEEMLINGISK